jgi:hypothetical protein
MAKRPSSGSKKAVAATAKRAKDGSSGSDTVAGGSAGSVCSGLGDDVAKQDVQHILLMYPWLQRVIERFELEWSECEDISDIMNKHVSDPDEWAKYLDGTFPAEGDVDYISNWDSFGQKFVRPWHFSWHPQAGNKGVVEKFQFKNLMTLMLTKGFESNPMLPGVEQPVVKPPNPIFFQSGELDSLPCISDKLLPAYSVHNVKSWTRGVAMNMVILCLKLEGLMDKYLDMIGDTKKRSFATIHVNHVDTTRSDEIDMNRGRGLHCFSS